MSATTVYLGLGSNLGDRAALIAAAVDGLVAAHALRDVHLSPLYETDAVAPEPQPAYLNAVARGTTALGAEALLAACLGVEQQLGRVRPVGVEKAPRAIDIDILLFGDVVRAAPAPAPTLPHPALGVRPFVLIPLADVAAPGLIHPVTGAPLTEAPTSPGVRRFGPSTAD